MNKPKLFILCGEAFSGKSTLAKEISKRYEAKIVGRDEIYFAVEKLLALEETPDEDDIDLWNQLLPLAIQGTKNQLLLGNSVVFDDNCLKLEQRDKLRSLAEELSIDNVLIFLDIPKEILRMRKEANKISKERHDVPSAWLDEDSESFERPTENENPIVYKEGTQLEDILNMLRK
jgi:predicted kinase